ncbi:MAG TPA: hypothetical protein VF226_16575, partial [Hyphomicrobiaceae bacterium]
GREAVSIEPNVFARLTLAIVDLRIDLPEKKIRCCKGKCSQGNRNRNIGPAAMHSLGQMKSWADE